MRHTLGLISNTAGGYSFFRDARLRRLTRYRDNNVSVDTPGRYVYLREDATGEFWSPTWQPTRQPLERYVCRHGLGYTVIASARRGIEAAIRYFVPLSQQLEIWQLTVTNRRDDPVALSVFSAVEFRGVTCRISVRRTGPGNAVTLSVDGRPIASTVIPLPPEGCSEVRVEVMLGDEAPSGHPIA